MNIAILGTGNRGGVLGKRLSEKGHHITFGSRNPESEKIQQLIKDVGNGTKAAAISNSVDDVDVVVLATPWSAAEGILDQIGNLQGKVLIDATNPITEGLSGLTINKTISAGEMIAQWCPGAKVVKAFNTTGSSNINNPRYNSNNLSRFSFSLTSGEIASVS